MAELKDDCISAIEAAIRIGPKEETPAKSAQDEEPSEDSPEGDEEKPTESPNSGQLLDRLLYRGVLPRYAFPTDVATFHVFDQALSSRFRPIMRFAPSQGLPIALSQYAPGKQIWISGILAVAKSGKRFAIALSGPLTVDHPAEASIRELREKTSDIQFIVVNELLVRGNLPAATREVRQRMGA